jgi:elongation factor 1-gamma
MSLTLYAHDVKTHNYRAWKTLIAAQYNGVNVEVPAFELHKDNATADFKAKNPLGKVPVLDTPHGAIFESNAIARYVAGLRLDTELLGASYFERAQVDQWLDFSTNELEPTASIWLYPVWGEFDFDQSAYDGAKKDMTEILKILDSHLLTRTFLVGHRISLADIALASALVDCFRDVFDAAFRKPFGNVSRWFNTCVNQPEFVAVIGKVALCKKEKMAKGAKKAAPKKKAKKANADSKAAPASKKKAKNPLDLLPKSSMSLDATKKAFFNHKPTLEKFFESEFWEMLDAEGYSLWKSAYQYNNENTIGWMTSNLVAGWVQRLESLRKYGFGSIIMHSTDGETKPFNISGAFLVRGTELCEELGGCPDSAYHTFTKLDHTNAEDRQTFADLFTADKFSGEVVIERTYIR